MGEVKAKRNTSTNVALAVGFFICLAVGIKQVYDDGMEKAFPGRSQRSVEPATAAPQAPADTAPQAPADTAPQSPPPKPTDRPTAGGPKTKAARTLSVGRTTRPTAVGALGTPSWVFIPGDAVDGENMGVPTGLVELVWHQNDDCPPVRATFDRRGVLRGLDEGRTCVGQGMGAWIKKKNDEAGKRITCENRKRRHYCRTD